VALLATLKELDSTQRKTVLASFLGWTLDAFDFFLLVFVVPQIAAEFKVGAKEVLYSLTLTLALRPLGALIFGRLADRFGRKPILMIDVMLFAAFEFASAFAPSLAALLVIRALFGIAMGGEWGIGASLAMETIPAKARGAISGLLQEGYSTGYLLGAAAYGLLFDRIGWRGMFMLGAIPAVLVLFIRRHVPESPAWEKAREAKSDFSVMKGMKGHWKRFVYLVLLMMCFNCFSHGSQDVYPTFLKTQLKFDTTHVSILVIVLNLGAICGGLTFGPWSEKIGRKRAIAIAALCSLIFVPLWAFSRNPIFLGIGVFGLQFCVQGAWGIVPVHLNELAPPTLRGTLPGFAYQGGNLCASFIAPLLASIAAAHDGDYGLAMAIVISVVAIALATVTMLGPEAKGMSFEGGKEMPTLPAEGAALS
jgi:SHS family lactate transporter-like MFS transporter